MLKITTKMHFNSQTLFPAGLPYGRRSYAGTYGGHFRLGAMCCLVGWQSGGTRAADGVRGTHKGSCTSDGGEELGVGSEIARTLVRTQFGDLQDVDALEATKRVGRRRAGEL